MVKILAAGFDWRAENPYNGRKIPLVIDFAILCNRAYIKCGLANWQMEIDFLQHDYTEAYCLLFFGLFTTSAMFILSYKYLQTGWKDSDRLNWS